MYALWFPIVNTCSDLYTCTYISITGDYEVRYGDDDDDNNKTLQKQHKSEMKVIVFIL